MKNLKYYFLLLAIFVFTKTSIGQKKTQIGVDFSHQEYLSKYKEGRSGYTDFTGIGTDELVLFLSRNQGGLEFRGGLGLGKIEGHLSGYGNSERFSHPVKSYYLVSPLSIRLNTAKLQDVISLWGGLEALIKYGGGPLVRKNLTSRKLDMIIEVNGIIGITYFGKEVDVNAGLSMGMDGSYLPDRLGLKFSVLKAI